jgi:acyl-coenzyme A thioesterase PaaI-like protein
LRAGAAGVGTAVLRCAAVAGPAPGWHEVQRALAAVTPGWELLAISPEEGTIEVAFTAGGAFLNPAGVVQGGFLAAMLDETMGPALVGGLEPGDFAPSADRPRPVATIRDERSA